MEKREELQKEAFERYQNLQFRDDFLFCKILVERPDIAKDLLELILGTPIRKVVPKSQKTIEITADARGIRLDVYLDDDLGTVYDLEMQTTKNKNLPKRSRYYQGMIDLDMINRGVDFSALKKSYIIFICMDDPFDEGRHIYSFENICKENPLTHLGDESYKVFLNAKGTLSDVSDNLLDFFQLILTGKGNTKLSKEIESEVEKAKSHKEWRMEYMTLFMRDRETRAEERIAIIQRMLKKGCSPEFILDLGFSKEELDEAEKTLL